MAVKKTTVNLSEASQEKMISAIKDSGMSQSDFINKAILEIPIIMLGDRKSIAQSFFELRLDAEKNNDMDFKKGVEDVCRSLNLLIQKIEERNP